MAYQKILIDNVTCSRRFHIAFDDEAQPSSQVEVRCQLCNAVVFSAENHPPVRLAREENVDKTANLSEHIVTECLFEDVLSQRTIKGYPSGKLYSGERP